jgi:hypothetical protein
MHTNIIYDPKVLRRPHGDSLRVHILPERRPKERHTYPSVDWISREDKTLRDVILHLYSWVKTSYLLGLSEPQSLEQLSTRDVLGNGLGVKPQSSKTRKVTVSTTLVYARRRFRCLDAVADTMAEPRSVLKYPNRFTAEDANWRMCTL